MMYLLNSVVTEYKKLKAPISPASFVWIPESFDELVSEAQFIVKTVGGPNDLNDYAKWKKCIDALIAAHDKYIKSQEKKEEFEDKKRQKSAEKEENKAEKESSTLKKRG